MIPDEIRLPGAVSTLEPVTARRSSRVWRVTLADGLVLALKYTTDDDGAGQVRAFAEREAAVLRLLDGGASLYASGTTPTGSWLAVTWHQAVPLGEPWRCLRYEDTSKGRAEALTATWRAARAIGDLHERGWRHGDLQADHILIDDAGRVRLVDLAFAQGPVIVAPDVTYRGALAHLTAPEVAAEILATPPTHHINLNAAAEVYMFGAVLRAAWAGRWPRDYGADQSAALTVAQVHTIICDPRSLRPMPHGWPALAALLASMLDPAPANRPSMTEVTAALHSEIGGRL